MKLYLTFVILIFSQITIMAQKATDYFNRAANEYIYKNEQVALNTIGSGLAKYPDDQKLKRLKEKIEKDKQDKDQEKNQDQQNQDDQQNEKQEEQQNKDEQEKDKEEQQQENQDQESEDDENAEDKDQSQDAQPEETDEEGKEMDEPPQTRKEKLKELNLTEEKAQMILEAMKNNEIQYIQQNTRKATKRPDSDKPDW